MANARRTRPAAASRKSSWLLLALVVAWVSPARADLRQAINAARLQGCRAPAGRVPLREDAGLAAAATRVADGQSLHAALSASGYLATQSSVLHLSGSVGDGAVRRALESTYCATLIDPNLKNFAVLRRGQEVWVILAAPVVLPDDQEGARFSQEILALVNAARAHARRCGGKSFGPAAPLALRSALTRAAQAHSEEMAKYLEFDHRGHDRSTPAERVARAGYGAYSVVGENIAAGAMTPAEVTEGWLDSPAHCENIMDPRFSDIGIAFAVNRSSPQLIYWTQDFAAPVAGGAAPSRPRLNP